MSDQGFNWNQRLQEIIDMHVNQRYVGPEQMIDQHYDPSDPQLDQFQQNYLDLSGLNRLQREQSPSIDSNLFMFERHDTAQLGMPSPLLNAPSVSNQSPMHNSPVLHDLLTAPPENRTNTPEPKPEAPKSPLYDPDDLNHINFCKLGQYTVQDIVLNFRHLFDSLKRTKLPVKPRTVKETMRLNSRIQRINLLFKRLRLIYGICAAVRLMDKSKRLEFLIPTADTGLTHKPAIPESLSGLVDENNRLREEVILKNQQIKDVIDSYRRIMWSINTMTHTASWSSE